VTVLAILAANRSARYFNAMKGSYQSQFRYGIRKAREDRRAHRSIDDELCDREIERCRHERERKNGAHPPAPAPERYCNCAESILNGKRVPCRHDCAYVAARSALVYQACRLNRSGANSGRDPQRQHDVGTATLRAVRAVTVAETSPERASPTSGVQMLNPDQGQRRSLLQQPESHA